MNCLLHSTSLPNVNVVIVQPSQGTAAAAGSTVMYRPPQRARRACECWCALAPQKNRREKDARRGPPSAAIWASADVRPVCCAAA